MLNTMVGYGKPALLPTPTKGGMAAVTQGHPAPSQVLPSSTTQPGQHNKAHADSSKKEKVTLSRLETAATTSRAIFQLSVFCLSVFFPLLL